MEKIDHVTVTKYQSQHDILPATRFIKSVTEQKDNNIEISSLQYYSYAKYRYTYPKNKNTKFENINILSMKLGFPQTGNQYGGVILWCLFMYRIDS